MKNIESAIIIGHIGSGATVSTAIIHSIKEKNVIVIEDPFKPKSISFQARPETELKQCYEPMFFEEPKNFINGKKKPKRKC